VNCPEGLHQVGQVVMPYWHIGEGFLAALLWFIIFKGVLDGVVAKSV
jgi:hypothetical protein